jgi:hypothetical protein
MLEVELHALGDVRQARISWTLMVVQASIGSIMSW